MPVNFTNSNTSHIDSNVNLPGPTGVVGDMKRSSAANPNITQADVGNISHPSREMSDPVDPRKKAFDNAEKGRELSEKAVSPDTQRAVLGTVMRHGDSSVSLKGNDPDSSPLA